MPQKHAHTYSTVYAVTKQPYGGQQPNASAGGHPGGLTLTKRPNIS